MHSIFSTINYLGWSRLSRYAGVRSVLGSVLVFVILFSGALGVVRALPASSDNMVRTTTFTLDHVAVTVASPFLPAKGFDTALPGLPSQIASEVAWSPFREFSVTAIPFGTRSATELGIVARPGAENDFRSSLYRFRQRQHALQQTGPSALLFGTRVTSSVSLVSLKLDSVHVQPAIIVEWVVEAGQRIWLIRVAREEPSGTTTLASASQFLTSLQSVSITSNTLTRLSAARAIPSQPIALPLPRNSSSSRSDVVGAQTDLPLPSWWNHGLCDTTLVRNSHPLGASYRGVLACGPGDAYVRNSKFPGSSQPYEWQSVELAMRYLYLAYRIPSYAAEANTIVANYAGSYPMLKISNGTKGHAPVPGDVVSFGTTSTGGHVALVTRSTVNGQGDGVVAVMEQNGDPTGMETLRVQHWMVQSNEFGEWVSGWLHATSSGLSGTATAAPYFLFPWDAPNSWYFTGGPHGWGNTTGGSGLDFAPNGSTGVLAAASGQVYYSGWDDWGAGPNLNVRIDHGGGWETWYLHLSSSAFGQSGLLSTPVGVNQGQYLGEVGSTGAPSVHIHIELVQNRTQHVSWNGQVIDGWTIHTDCVNGPSGCQPTNYNGYISNGSTSIIPESSPGPAQLVQSHNTRSSGGGNCTSAPNLSSPGDGQTMNSRSVTLVWNPPSGCSLGNNDGYTLHINTSPDPEAQPIIKDTGVGSNNGGTVSFPWTFSSDGTYYWHVRVCKPCTPYTPGTWANRRVIIDTSQVGPPNPPTLQSPGNGVALNNRAVTFSWSAPNSPNVTGYTLHVSTTPIIDGSGANLILDTGVGSTSFPYTFSQDYATLWWGVATWNSSNQRSGFTSAWTLTIDTTPPTADWSVPVGDGQSYHCQDGQTVQLGATASDNISVQKVHFLILLRTTGVWVDLGYDFSAPYESSIACSSLDLGLNQVDTCAHDTAGNVSDCKVFWLYRDPADTQPPIVNWVAPTGNTQVYHCQTQMVQLQADASDNVGVVDVHFDRWDAVNLQVVDLGDAYSPPYVANVGCTTLNFDWNQVDVTAYDAAGNSAGQYFWLSRDRTPSAPSNLTGQADTCSRVALAWTDNSDNEDGFNIYRNGSLIGRVASNVTAYRDNPLSRQGTYTYTVTAYLGTLESAPTSAISVATLSPYIKIHCSSS